MQRLKYTLLTLKAKFIKRYYGLAYKLHTRFPKLGIMRLKKRHFASAFLLLIISVLALNWLIEPAAKARTVTLSSNEILKSTTDYNQLQLGSDGASFSLQRGDLGQWSGGDGLQLAPTMNYSDNWVVYGPNSSLYTMMSYSNSCRFHRYVLETQVWQELTPPPVGCGSQGGSAIVSDGTTSVYLMAGAN